MQLNLQILNSTHRKRDRYHNMNRYIRLVFSGQVAMNIAMAISIHNAVLVYWLHVAITGMEQARYEAGEI